MSRILNTEIPNTEFLPNETYIGWNICHKTFKRKEKEKKNKCDSRSTTNKFFFRFFFFYEYVRVCRFSAFTHCDMRPKIEYKERNTKIHDATEPTKTLFRFFSFFFWRIKKWKKRKRSFRDLIWLCLRSCYNIAAINNKWKFLRFSFFFISFVLNRTKISRRNNYIITLYNGRRTLLIVLYCETQHSTHKHILHLQLGKKGK